jgi:hypothetical protein
MMDKPAGEFFSRGTRFRAERAASETVVAKNSDQGRLLARRPDRDEFTDRFGVRRHDHPRSHDQSSSLSINSW